jgi:hypothetical protein
VLPCTPLLHPRTAVCSTRGHGAGQTCPATRALMQCGAHTHTPAAIDAMRTPSICRKRPYGIQILCMHAVRYYTLAATGLRRSPRRPGSGSEVVVERAGAEGKRDSKVGPDASSAWGVSACSGVANLKDVLNPVLHPTACSIQGPLPLHRHLFPFSRQEGACIAAQTCNTRTLLRHHQTWRDRSSTLRARALAEPIKGN